ncbi:MAG: hypothetical protein WD468_12015 [Pirellulales bacterium]
MSLVAALCVASSVEANILSSGAGPTLYYGYHSGAGGGLDSNTTHYWNFDEGGVTYADTGLVSPSSNKINMTSSSGTASVSNLGLFSPGGAANSAVRIGTSATGSNRVTAFPLASNTTDNITAAQANSLYGSNGAITIDLMLRPDFGQTFHATASMRLINEENEESGNLQNLFLAYNSQTDVVPTNAHVIEFKMDGAGTQVQAVVPFTGDNALESGAWYHLAVIYTGDETATDNVKFYWTKISGPADLTPAANLIGTATLTADPLVFASTGPDFTFGNETNTTANKSWFGALDSIRISDIDRDPSGVGTGFIFFAVPEVNGFLMGLVCLSAMVVGSFCRRGQRAE